MKYQNPKPEILKIGFRVFRAVIGCRVFHGFRPSMGTETPTAAGPRLRLAHLRGLPSPRLVSLVCLFLLLCARRESLYFLHLSVAFWCVHSSPPLLFHLLFLCTVAVLRFRVVSTEQSARVCALWREHGFLCLSGQG